MATTPPIVDPVQPVQIKEDPDSLALRQRLIDQETRNADNVAAMNATQKQLVQALLVPPTQPVTDAELWRGFLHTAAAGVMRHPRFGDPMADAASVADRMLAEYRKRYPVSAAG